MAAIQTALNVSLATNQAALAQPAVTELFRQGYDRAIKCSAALTQQQMRDVQAALSFPVVFTGLDTNTSDHAVIAAFRQIARAIYSRDEFLSKNSSLIRLVVGASHREFANYNSCPTFKYYFHCSEGKDVVRTIVPVLSNLVNEQNRKALKATSAANRKMHLTRVNTLNDMVNRMQMNTILPETVSLKPVKASILLFEDSFYNYGPEEYVELFEQTGATAAIGYGFLPWNLQFADYPKTDFYNYNTRLIDGRIKSVLTFPGTANGYIHDTVKWGTLLACPVIVSGNCALEVEIIARIGPMVVFKIYRAVPGQTIVRTLSIPESERWVNVLDIWHSIDKRTCRLKRLHYFTVRESEFNNIVLYLASLDKKNITLPNCILMIRRRMGGYSLFNQELMPAWRLKQSEVIPTALIAVLFVLTMMTKLEKSVELLKITGVLEKFFRAARVAISVITWPISELIDWLLSENLTDKLITYPPHLYEHEQVYKVPKYAVKKFVPLEVLTSNVDYPDLIKNTPPIDDDSGSDDDDNDERQPPSPPVRRGRDLEKSGDSEESISVVDDSELPPLEEVGEAIEMEEIFDDPECIPKDFWDERVRGVKAFSTECEVCEFLRGKMGLQIVRCIQPDDTYHTWELTTDEVNEFRASLRSNDNDHIGLKTVKERMLSNTPTSGFSHRTKIRYIKGGPGTGKSETIKRMMKARPGGAVIAPFSRLMQAYMDEQENDYYFKTVHRTGDLKGKTVIYVDEFPAMDYRFIAVCAYNNAAEEVYLIGDTQQTGLRASEGVPSLSKLNKDMAGYNTHYLVYNFRNPTNTIMMMNEMFGYKMLDVNVKGVAGYDDFSSQYVPITVKPHTEINLNDSMKLMAFSKKAIREYLMEDPEGELPKCTVRTFQGSTEKDIGLLVTTYDCTNINVDALRIVALSRHKRNLVIYSDNSPTAQHFVYNMLNLEKYTEDKVKAYFRKFNPFNVGKARENASVEVLEDKTNPLSLVKIRKPLFLNKTYPAEQISKADERMLNARKHCVHMNENFAVELKIPSYVINLAADTPSIAEDVTFCGVHDEQRKRLVSQIAFVGEVAKMLKPLIIFVGNGEMKYLKIFSEVYPSVKWLVINPDAADGVVEELENVTVWAESYSHIVSENIGDFIVNNNYKNVSLICDINNVDPRTMMIKEIADTLRIDLTQQLTVYSDIRPIIALLKFDFPSNSGNLEYLQGTLYNQAWSYCSSTETMLWVDKQSGPTKHKVYDRNSYLKHCLHFNAVKRVTPVYIESASMLMCSDCARDAEFTTSLLSMSLTDGDIVSAHCNISADLDRPLPINKSQDQILGCRPNFEEFKRAVFSQLNEVVKLDKTKQEIEMQDYKNFEVTADTMSSDYVRVPGTHTENIIKNTTQAWVDQLQTINQYPEERVEKLAVAVIPADPKHMAPVEHPEYDAYKLADTLMPTALFSPDLLAPSTNDLESQVVNNVGGRTTVAYVEEIVNPINARGNPTTTLVNYQSASIGHGSHFSAANPNQELQVAVARYDPEYAKPKSTPEDVEFSRDLVERFFLRFKDPKKLEMVRSGNLDEERMSEMFDQFARDAKLKKYYEQWTGRMSGGGETTARDVGFRLKDIFKPNVDYKGSDPWKAGQGISQWSVELTSMIAFGTRFLQMLDEFTDVTKTESQCMTDNGHTEIAFMRRLMTEVKTKFKGKPFKKVLMDSIMFDAKQGFKSRTCSRAYYKALGCAEWFVEWYFNLSDNAKIYGQVFKAKTNAKTSGQPLTLHENGVLTKLSQFHIVETEGPEILAYKGDDALTMALSVKISEERTAEIEKHLDLKMKSSVAFVAEFCGLLMSETGLFPNLYRRLNKITAKKNRSYEKWCEYQQSLRDFVNLVKELGVNETIAATAFQRFSPPEEVEMIWACIQSFAHINKEQYESVMITRTERAHIPVVADESERIGNKAAVVFKTEI